MITIMNWWVFAQIMIWFYGWKLSSKGSTSNTFHIQTCVNITLFGSRVIYANNKMVCLEMELYYDNKSDNTWTKLLILLKMFLQIWRILRHMTLQIEEDYFECLFNWPFWMWKDFWFRSWEKFLSSYDGRV